MRLPWARVTELDKDTKNCLVVVQDGNGNRKAYTTSGHAPLEEVKKDMGITPDTPCNYQGGESVLITPKKGNS